MRAVFHAAMAKFRRVDSQVLAFDKRCFRRDEVLVLFVEDRPLLSKEVVFVKWATASLGSGAAEFWHHFSISDSNSESVLLVIDAANFAFIVIRDDSAGDLGEIL